MTFCVVKAIHTWASTNEPHKNLTQNPNDRLVEFKLKQVDMIRVRDANRLQL